MQGLRPLFFLRASGLHHSKKNHENRLARFLSLQTYKTYKAYLSA